MRRLALSVVTACGLALLSACSGGGYGFSTGNGSGSVDQVILSTGSGQTNDFFVAPLSALVPATAPLQVSAVGQKGSGPTAVIVPDTTFVWAARFVTAADPPSISQYVTGASPNGFRTCSFPTQTPPVPVYQQSVSSLVGPYPGYVPLPSGQAAKTVFIGAVPGVAAPYCLLLQATHVGDGVIGAHTVVVSSSP